MRIKWLHIALSDLEDAAQFISEPNPDAARKLVDRIWQSAQILADHPDIGRPGRIPGTRELIISGTHYILPYRVVKDVVQILRVLHCARKWPDRF
jgi:addiction module RelE/StbE family toxin